MRRLLLTCDRAEADDPKRSPESLDCMLLLVVHLECLQKCVFGRWRPRKH